MFQTTYCVANCEKNEKYEGEKIDKSYERRLFEVGPAPAR